MHLKTLFVKHTLTRQARRHTLLLLTVPSAAIVVFTQLFSFLQSPAIMEMLDFSYDRQGNAFINHSYWWVVSANIVGSLLTVSVIIWFLSLYPAYRSAHHSWQLSRPKARKARQRRTYFWIGVSLIVVPIVLFVVWLGIGQAIQFVGAPITQVMSMSSFYNDTLSAQYWSSDAFPTMLLFSLPFCLIGTAYCFMKRHRI